LAIVVATIQAMKARRAEPSGPMPRMTAKIRRLCVAHPSGRPYALHPLLHHRRAPRA
jgi:hypothetical protein